LNSDALAKPQESRRSQGAVSSSEVTDPLSDSLLFLAAYHGRALSREALLAGLPIPENRLSVTLFSRAAQRAGLEVEPVKRALPEIPALVLPVVLIMRDGSTRIMVSSDAEPRNAKVIDPTIKPHEAPRPLAPR
jgi:ATP-binding cassette, subfamily C, bacterial LapB